VCAGINRPEEEMKELYVEGLASHDALTA